MVKGGKEGEKKGEVKKKKMKEDEKEARRRGEERNEDRKHKADLQYYPDTKRALLQGPELGSWVVTRQARHPLYDRWHLSSYDRDASGEYGCRSAIVGPSPYKRSAGCSRNYRAQETPRRKSPAVCESRHGDR